MSKLDSALTQQAEQLPLSLWSRQPQVFDTFVDGPNAGVRSSLQAQLQGAREQEAILYLAGVSGSGKTHLAEALCQHATSLDIKASRFDLAALHSIGPSVLQGLEQLEWMVLDGLEAVLGEPAWELALFNLLNRARNSANSTVLLIAQQVPAELAVNLPDLKTRLSWGPGYQLKALTADTDLRELLRRRAEHSGWQLSEKNLDKIFRRHPRNPAALSRLFASLQTRASSRKLDMNQRLIDQLLLEAADDAAGDDVAAR